MRTSALFLGLSLSVASQVFAVSGDLNLDGRVDFDDFFLFADNFGKEGPPDTLRVVVIDSLVHVDTLEVLDTIEVEFLVPPTANQVSEFAIPELDSVSARALLEDVDRDSLAEGLTVWIEFLRRTDDPFSPYAQVPPWSGIWWEFHYSVFFDQADGADVTSTLARRAIHIDSHSWITGGISQIQLVADSLNTSDLPLPYFGRLRMEGVVRTQVQGDYPVEDSFAIEVTSSGRLKQP